jgi:Fic family protein
MTSYHTLEKLFHADRSADRQNNIFLEAQRRLTDETTFRTDIKIKTGEVFLAMPRELTLLNEKMLRVERKVSLLWRELPGIARWAYLYGLITNEIFYTNELEGVRSTRRQIERALQGAEARELDTSVRRFREFARLYLELTDKDHVYPSSPKDIRRIYDSVVAGELPKKDLPDGKLFRAKTVQIVSSRQKVIHTGITPEARIIEMLGQMLNLVSSPDIPATYSALISHFLFEYIHPFYDGNGRTGRYLLALYLGEPLSQTTVLSLSKTIAENKSKYYAAFETVERPLNHAEVTPFVIQMMQLIRIAQDVLIENLQTKRDHLNRAEESLESQVTQPFQLNPKASELLFLATQYYLFAAFPEVTLKDMASFIGLGIQSTRNHTVELEKKGLLQTLSLRPLRFTLTDETLTRLGINAVG